MTSELARLSYAGSAAFVRPASVAVGAAAGGIAVAAGSADVVRPAAFVALAVLVGIGGIRTA